MWDRIRSEAESISDTEPFFYAYIHEVIIDHRSLSSSLGYLLSSKLASSGVNATALQEIFAHAFEDDSSIVHSVLYDLEAIFMRDPAATSYVIPYLFYKGFHALESYRVAHRLWRNDRKAVSYYIQNRVSEVFAIDIHPAAHIGHGIFIDHGTSIVIGETSVIENNVSMLHEVTLGGTGKECGDRHPKIREGVLIGAGAKILGNIEIGRNAKVGSGSVVVRDVHAHVTVAGVPARGVGRADTLSPALSMSQELPVIPSGVNGSVLDFQI
ncbi:MAG TPA: serine O-acetyltransferase [Spirochaetota bacterium]|nr:serine O-acetyltransferase [Spirochaetota bacterium]